MSQELGTAGGQSPSSFRLPLHFDIKQSRLPADDFIKALEGAIGVFRELENQFVSYEGTTARSQLFILPAEDGSFKAILLLVGITASVFTIETNENTANFAYEITEEKYEGGQIGTYLGKMVKGILEKEVSEIDRIVTTSGVSNIDAVIKKKSDFYKVVEGNQDIIAVSFDDDLSNPIRRNRFFQHISSSRKVKLKSKWEYRTAIIAAAVTIDKDNKWRFIDVETMKIFTAKMHDDAFRYGFLRESKYPLKETANPDTIHALFEIEQFQEDGVIKDGDIHVRKVFRFNDIIIFKAPKNEEPHTRASIARQLDLFVQSSTEDNTDEDDK